MTKKTQKKTWFLPPDFTFLPDSQLALGSVISHPSRPIDTLANIEPNLLPRVNVVTEKNHVHSREATRSFGTELLANIISLVSNSGISEFQRINNLTFGPVDHEVRTFSRALDDAAIQSLLSNSKVKRYVKSSRFGGYRPVYIITGLRVVTSELRVSEEVNNKTSWSLQAEVPLVAVTGVPLDVGAGFSVSIERSSSTGYATAPGVVFAYRLHVLRPQTDDSGSTALFSSSRGFMDDRFFNEEEEEEEEEPIFECVETTTQVVDEDLEMEVQFQEHSLGDTGLYVVFGN